VLVLPVFTDKKVTEIILGSDLVPDVDRSDNRKTF